MAAVTKVSMADVALCHVSDRDVELLAEWSGYDHGRQEAAPIVTYELAGGYGFIVDLRGVEEQGWLGDILEAGFSPAFAELLRFCQLGGCQYALLDQDSAATDGLLRFDRASYGPPYDAATAAGMYDP